MQRLMSRLWADDGGAIIAMEWVFIATILVLGIITGLVAVRQAVLAELTDVANAILALNQCYSFAGQSNCISSTCGSAFNDTPDSIPLFRTPAIASSATQLACD